MSKCPVCHHARWDCVCRVPVMVDGREVDTFEILDRMEALEQEQEALSRQFLHDIGRIVEDARRWLRDR